MGEVWGLFLRAVPGPGHWGPQKAASASFVCLGWSGFQGGSHHVCSLNWLTRRPGEGPAATGRQHLSGRTRGHPFARRSASISRGDRLCSRVSPGKAPTDPAPREAQWGAGCWGQCPGHRCSGQGPTPPGLRFPAHRDAPRSARGLGFLERSSPGPSQARDCSHLHSSRASPSQRKAWWALATAWQLSGTLAPAPSGCFTPRLAFCCWCKPATPEPAQLGARGRGGASWMGTQPMGAGWGEPSWPPAWPEQLGLDGRKGGYLQLPQAGVGLGRNTMAYEGPAGHPAPVTSVQLPARRAPPGPAQPWRSVLKNPRWRAAEDHHGDARPAEGPLSVPASCHPLRAEARGK